MADPSQFNNKKFEKEFKESLRVVSDGISSLGSQLNEVIVKGAKDTTEKAEKNVLANLRRSVTASFKSIADDIDKLSVKQEQIKRGELSYNQVVKNANKLRDKITLLETKRNKLLALGVDLSAEQRKDLEGFKDELEETLKTQEEFSESIEKKAGALGEVLSRLSNLPFVGELINGQEATEKMRKSLAEGNSAMTALGDGAAAAFKNIERASIILAVISTLKKVFDFIVSSAMRADELTTAVAKNLGVSQKSAEALRKNMQRANDVLASSAYITDDLIQAQQELVNLQGALTLGTEEQIEGQAFLTKFIGLQGENAAFVNTMLANQGKNAKEVFDSINAATVEQAKQNGFHVTASEIMREIGDTSADILANFGFNTDEIANAVLQTRRFGVTLTQAKNIAGGLLDFESSIASELEAEILLGKQFNFERARALAATGDIAGATAEVLAQTENLTDEQLKSPIIQEAIAKATGQSAEEFAKARQISKNLNLNQEKYNKLLERGGKIGLANAVESLALEGATVEQIEANLTAQEKFNNAITNAKDQFADLVGSGVIQSLTEFIPQLLKALGVFTGTRYQQVDIEELEQKIRAKGIEQKKTETEIQEALNKARQKYYDEQAQLRERGNVTKGKKKQYGNRAVERLSGEAFKVDDFTIRANPKDTLVMAGGTKFGEETNSLLKQLISIVNKKAIIDIDEQAFISNAITYSTK